MGVKTCVRPVQNQVSSLHPMYVTHTTMPSALTPLGGPVKIKALWTCGRENKRKSSEQHLITSGIKVELSSRGSLKQPATRRIALRTDSWAAGKSKLAGRRNRLPLSGVHCQRTVSTPRPLTYHGSAKTTFDPEMMMSLFCSS